MIAPDPELQSAITEAKARIAASDARATRAARAREAHDRATYELRASSMPYSLPFPVEELPLYPWTDGILIYGDFEIHYDRTGAWFVGRLTMEANKEWQRANNGFPTYIRPTDPLHEIIRDSLIHKYGEAIQGSVDGELNDLGWRVGNWNDEHRLTARELL